MQSNSTVWLATKWKEVSANSCRDISTTKNAPNQGWYPLIGGVFGSFH